VAKDEIMNHREKYAWLYDLLFLLVFLLAGYLRLTGLNWGEAGGQHPDENHFSGVLDSMRAQTCANPNVPLQACPAEQKQWIGLGEYFNSATSPLNPYNRGAGSYVYGNLPMTIIRILADATSQTNLRVFARHFSAFADLFAIFFLYLLVSHMYGRRVGLLAALFSALTVMQIQQSHFFTVDLFVNAFAMLVLWFAVMILEHGGDDNSWEREAPGAVLATEAVETQESSPGGQDLDTQLKQVRSLITHPLFILSLGFGFALGMAMASKINIAPLAVVLPAAFIIRFLVQYRASGGSLVDYWNLNHNYWTLVIFCLVAGGLATFISFRVFQPYTFDGLGLDPRWVADITQQRAQATGEADLPWNLQWARRSHLFSFTNITLWGLGLPLGILAWAGFIYMGWRILKGEWRHALLWGWTALYFLWQSLQFNPTMRYQLPIYPLLVMMAAWFVFELAGWGRQPTPTGEPAPKRFNFAAVLASVLAFSVLILTAIWAFAFHSIYLRDEPRIAASRWIFQNVPGPINLQIDTNKDGIYSQPLPFPFERFVQAGRPYEITFLAESDGVLESIMLGHALNKLTPSSTLTLSVSATPRAAPEEILARASLTSDFAAQGDPRGASHTLRLDKPISLKADSPYYLRLEVDEGILQISGATVANETDYDYPLPLRVDHYDAFGGIYRGDLNLQVYWPDDTAKLNRFVTTLKETDYILIPTNHQYGQITRLPERYPLTTLYYRELIGCPEENEIISCYRVAQPGQFKGRLGFDLVAVFETYPTFGPIVINDQPAEEAFTFYDHPKVMIFQKNEDFDVTKVQSILGSVDLTKVVPLTPRQFDDYSSLLLPADRLAQQRAGGTWSELFDYDWLQNRFPVLGLLLWYFFIFLLGLAVYPLTRLAMPGLADK
jgi:hypothetical protein